MQICSARRPGAILVMLAGEATCTAAHKLREYIVDRSQVLIERISELTGDRSTPLMVAIDGRSGAGKSTIAAAVSTETGAVVINGDDFYAGGTAEEWDAMAPADRAAHCIDWRRQRPVLEALSRGDPASWRAYDWDAHDGRLTDRWITCSPSRVVILEGVYSARPELADLLDLRVMLDVEDRIRRRRLLHREGNRYRARWEARWASAEEHYFATVMPADAFDLVL